MSPLHRGFRGGHFIIEGDVIRGHNLPAEVKIGVKVFGLVPVDGRYGRANVFETGRLDEPDAVDKIFRIFGKYVVVVLTLPEQCFKMFSLTTFCFDFGNSLVQPFNLLQKLSFRLAPFHLEPPLSELTVIIQE